MDVTLNGKRTVLAGCESVAELISTLDLSGKCVAVEHNGQIVPRGLHCDTLIAEGDTIEVVVAVGGG